MEESGREKEERRKSWRDWLPDSTDQWSSFGAGGSTRSQDWNTQLSIRDSKGNFRYSYTLKGLFNL